MGHVSFRHDFPPIRMALVGFRNSYLSVRWLGAEGWHELPKVPERLARFHKRLRGKGLAWAGCGNGFPARRTGVLRFCWHMIDMP
jgi:hypothetical protein